MTLTEFAISTPVHTPVGMPLADATSASASPSANSLAASLALVRVFVWETSEHSAALGRYFQEAGHPFVLPAHESLPIVVRDRSLRGQVFEMFTLPIDLGGLFEMLNGQDAQRDIEAVVDLSELPLLFVRRKARPADPLHPERELQCVLKLLPQWRHATAQPRCSTAHAAHNPLRDESLNDTLSDVLLDTPRSLS